MAVRRRPTVVPVRLVLLLVAVLTGGCAGGAASSGGFASGAGVLGCAEQVVWGTVAASEAARDGVRVTVQVEEWVVPAQGEREMTFLADDPSRRVGASAWPTGGRFLVVLAPPAPAQHHVGADADRLLQQWREAGAPRWPPAQCRNS